MIAFAQSGDSFVEAVKKVQQSLSLPNDYCDLEFNEIRVRVSKNSNLGDLCTIYDLKHHINRIKSGARIF